MPKSKHEIDKEIMYSKLIPTALKKSIKESETPLAPPPAPSPEPEAPPAPPAQKEVRTLNVSTDLYEVGDGKMLVNLVEFLVWGKMDPVLEKLNCCSCNRCKRQIASLALNRIAPKYAIGTEQELLGALQDYAGVEVTSAIIQAAMQVKNHPVHE